MLGYSAQTGADGSFLIEITVSTSRDYRPHSDEDGFDIWDYNE